MPQTYGIINYNLTLTAFFKGHNEEVINMRDCIDFSDDVEDEDLDYGYNEDFEA